MAVNPYGEVKKECIKLLQEALEKIKDEIGIEELPQIVIEEPPDPRLGDLASPICIILSKMTKREPVALAKLVSNLIDTSSSPLVERIEVGGEGYINFFLNRSEYAKLVVESVRDLKESYGLLDFGKGISVMVEHTSANPVHPLHIGTARNAILGDALARVLKAVGHDVITHFYINDMGRQVATLVYGYSKLDEKKPEGKPDHWLGRIYAVTNAILFFKSVESDINALIRLLDDVRGDVHILKEVGLRDKQMIDDIEKYIEDINEIWKGLKDRADEIMEWEEVASELRAKYPKLYAFLEEKIAEDEDPEAEIQELMAKYEEGDEEAKRLFREVCELCIDGFKQTLERAGIHFDSFDWESDLVWSGLVDRVLEELSKTGFLIGDIHQERGLLYVDMAKACEKLETVREIFDITEEELEKMKKSEDMLRGIAPNFVLRRTAGTTLYTTRDIAYSLWKFEEVGVDKVINVIAAEQSLEQKQVRASLAIMGYDKYAKNLHHFAYELVHLQGMRMSGRRGRFISFDELMDKAVERAYEELNTPGRKARELPEDVKKELAEQIGVGLVRFMLLSVDPSKPLILPGVEEASSTLNRSPEELTDMIIDRMFMSNAPSILYAHARARSILRKAGALPSSDIDYSLLSGDTEWHLIMQISKLPEVVASAASGLRPDILCDYLTKLMLAFSAFYEKVPVLSAGDERLRNARLALVDAFGIALRNALNLIGIRAPEVM